MKVPVIWIGNPDQTEFDVWWDQTMIKDIVNGDLWLPAQGYEFEHHHGIAGLLSSDPSRGGMVIIPARHWVEANKEPELKEYLDKLSWRILLIVGDEESRFNFEQYKDNRTKVWLMAPTMEEEADFYLSSGYAPSTRQLVRRYEQEYLNKPLDWFFAGQNNHVRRQLSTEILTKMVARKDIKGRAVLTKGFTQGIPHEDYFKEMVSAKAVPCLPGVRSPDNFRIGESLESGSVPVADEFSSLVNVSGYWQKVFNEQGVPFKVFNDYNNLEGYIVDTCKRDYPALQNRVFAWWQQYKRFMSYRLNEHVHELSGSPYPNESLRSKITCVIPTSPLRSHPDTAIIEQTISSVRTHLPDCEIIITFDGVRGEQEDYRQQYEEYIKIMLWKCNVEYKNVMPLIFDEHSHQVKMARKALEYVKTPLILYVEADCPIYPDRKIEWGGLSEAILSGEANMIRLSHEGSILEPHRHLMLDAESKVINGVSLRRTQQWSQRPHLASTVYYKHFLNTYFSEDANAFIEDKMYGVVTEAVNIDGEMGWFAHRVWIYTPAGHEDIKRSFTTDGRAGDMKYDDTQKF